jgi:tRNA threonylcarbamoyladenosine biosynthesis protein TsaE
MKLILTSDNLETTLAIGHAIGKTLTGGETIELDSDLGGGKTALTKGIAAGMGNHDTVQSPTFTISRIYRCDNGLELHHFDFYRLQDPGIMAAELAESVSEDYAVVVIEWSGIVADILPPERITIKITATGETTRRLAITAPDVLSKKLNIALQKFAKESQ